MSLKTGNIEAEAKTVSEIKELFKIGKRAKREQNGQKKARAAGQKTSLESAGKQFSKIIWQRLPPKEKQSSTIPIGHSLLLQCMRHSWIQDSNPRGEIHTLRFSFQNTIKTTSISPTQRQFSTHYSLA